MAVMRLTRKLDEITPKYLQDNFLRGLKIVDDDGQPWPDSWYEEKIATAVQKFQEKTQVHVVSDLIEREEHDYDARDYINWCYVELFVRPVRSVEKFEVKFPTNSEFTEWPKEWCKVSKGGGQIQIVATSGTISQVMIGQGGMSLPLMRGQVTYLPKFFHVSYRPGFPNDDIPLNIVNAICKLAAIECLTDVSDTVYPAGATSMSVSKDGQSQSISINSGNGKLPAVFASKIGYWTIQLYGSADQAWNGETGDLGSIKKFYHGINMTVV